MKNYLFFLLALFFGIQLQAQKEAAIWYFGRNAGLDFNSGVPVAITDGQLDTYEGCSTISDSNGNLIFYSDGITVWNRNHIPMPNGTGLLGDPSSSQSAIIVPRPTDANTFYIFTTGADLNRTGTNYSVIDISLDGGLGDVTAKNLPLLSEGTEKLTAVKHANNRDIWVITHGFANNNFHAYLISPLGLNTSPVTSSVGLDLTPAAISSNAAGMIKASPNGSKLAISHRDIGAEILDFDTATGRVSNPVFLSDETGDLYALEFSPSGRVLYFNKDGDIYQLDLNAPDIAASAIAIDGGVFSFGALQLGIDGKIYVARFFRDYVSVINSPEVLGLGCDYVENAVNLGSGISFWGLPPFIQSYFQVNITAQNLCHTNSTEFSILVSEPIISINWDFGDGNASILENPAHTYTNTGTYTVSVTVTTSSETRTETKDITIYENPMANTVANFEVCSTTTTHTFDLSTKDIEVLGVQLPMEHMISYYSNLVDAQNGSKPLPSSYTNTNATETVYARISNNANASCFDITSFDLEVKIAPVLNTVEDWVVCDTDADGYYNFDLTLKNSEVLNAQNATTFTVNYFESQADADLNTNAIGSMYTNTSSSQELFFRIENTISSECFETGSFSIEVITAISATQPTNIEICDDDNDGFFTLNLTAQNAQILNGQSTTNFSVSYYTSRFDADNKANTLSAINYTNTIANRETLYARVENNANTTCYNTTFFDLIVYNSPVKQSVANWQICDDDNDGFQSFNLTDKDVEVLGSQSITDFSVSYHQTQVDATTDQNAITGIFQNAITNTQSIFYRLENNTNTTCFITGSFALEVFDTPLANTPEPIIVCDTNETGIQTIDFTSKDGEVLNNQDANVYSVSYHKTETEAIANQNPLPKQGYSNTNQQETIYARIQNKQLETCYDIVQFELFINPLPESILDEVYVICPDSPELEIDGGDFETWSWRDENDNEIHSDRIINILNIGRYSLTVSHTLNGVVCEKTIDFEVVSSGAPETFTVNTSGFSDRIAIVVNAEGVGDFEYSVDGQNFQASNEFEVFPGEHTIYVRDPFLCRTITEDIFVLGYQRFFTPNGDNTNEYWTVIGTERYPESMIYIYDRYGKLLKQLRPTDKGWNGMHNGLPLPSSDYWFKYIYDVGKVYTGHFSLKR